MNAQEQANVSVSANVQEQTNVSVSANVQEQTNKETGFLTVNHPNARDRLQ
jgi:hypothetical protein